jgi:hypothetical protein
MMQLDDIEQLGQRPTRPKSVAEGVASFGPHLARGVAEEMRAKMGKAGDIHELFADFMRSIMIAACYIKLNDLLQKGFPEENVVEAKKIGELAAEMLMSEVPPGALPK